MSLMKLLSSFCDVETDPLKLSNFPKGAELVSIWVRNQSETVRLHGCTHAVERSFINYC